jgi:hypothetical protein
VHWDGAKAQNYIIQNFCTNGGQILLFLSSTKEINFSFHFKRYNLTIWAVNFFETFCTRFPSSLGKDPTTGSAKKFILFLIWASWARNGRFGVFFEKNGLGPLGVKGILMMIITRDLQKCNWSHKCWFTSTKMAWNDNTFYLSHNCKECITHNAAWLQIAIESLCQHGVNHSGLTPKAPFPPKWLFGLFVILYETSKIRELNEFQDKVIFSHKKFLDQKLCGFLDLKANQGKAGSTKNFFKCF